MTVPIMQTGTVAHADACFIVVIQLNTQQKRCLYQHKLPNYSQLRHIETTVHL